MAIAVLRGLSEYEAMDLNIIDLSPIPFVFFEPDCSLPKFSPYLLFLRHDC